MRTTLLLKHISSAKNKNLNYDIKRCVNYTTVTPSRLHYSCPFDQITSYLIFLRLKLFLVYLGLLLKCCTVFKIKSTHYKDTNTKICIQKFAVDIINTPTCTIKIYI